MAGLTSWERLPTGGSVRPEESPRTRTGGWRTGTKPAVDLSRCVNCLLCWLHCPDAAVLVEGEGFAGFDYDFCKGCGICAALCPTDAIQMVPEEAAQ